LHAEDLLAKVKEEITKLQTYPAFIGVHLFAYRNPYDEIVHFVEQIENEHIHVVRGDDFLDLAKQHLIGK
jgi:hypothetical protein